MLPGLIACSSAVAVVPLTHHPMGWDPEVRDSSIYRTEQLFHLAHLLGMGLTLR